MDDTQSHDSESTTHNAPNEASQPVKGEKHKSKRLYLFIIIFILLCMMGSGLSVVGYQTYSMNYHRELTLAQIAVQHLQTAEAFLKVLRQRPFDAQSVSQAQHEFTAALNAFVQVNNDLKSLPGISTFVPVYGPRLNAALHVLPIAIEASQAGIVACNVLNLVISRFHEPLNTQSQGMTMADFMVIEKDFHQIKTTLQLITSQINQLQPSDVQLDPRISKLVAAFHKNMPMFQTWLNIVEQFLPVMPTLLGIGTPANYLIELLDSTELRPGGGFMGNYGILSFSGGRLINAHITDVYLLDRPFEAAGKVIPYPAAYSWFDLAPATWTFRDSNLDADFPTVARYSEANYMHEGGKIPIRGVIAFTPTLIQQALAITGPISVPEYHEIVTPQNLIDRIHHYQLALGNGDNPSPDKVSSVRKHFTALLAEHFLARVRQIAPSAMPELLKLFITSIRSKDVQIYFNSSPAEALLQSLHLNSAIQSPNNDSLFVVDANISPNKANKFITNNLNDQVTIDVDGNTIHHTTLSYSWATKGQVYGSALYRDYVRIYVPPGSILQEQNGWQPRSQSQAFEREVWAGFFTLTYGKKRTINLIWKVPGKAIKDAKGWHYQYLIQRQAGAQWTLHLQIMLPSCAAKTNIWGGLALANKQMATLIQPLVEDLTLGIDYTCKT